MTMKGVITVRTMQYAMDKILKSFQVYRKIHEAIIENISSVVTKQRFKNSSNYQFFYV